MDIQQLSEQFTQQLSKDGYTETLTRSWEPNQQVATHSHPFDAHALVLQGEFTLSWNGQSKILRQGDTFSMAAGCEHVEQYGAQGATYLVGRRHVTIAV